MLNSGGAIQEVLRPNKTFPEYMHLYHDSWYEFSKERGHDVAPEDIVMVRGTVKASEWTVAAFTDETRHQSLHLEAQGGSFGSVGVSLALSDASSMSVEHRCGSSLVATQDNMGLPVVAGPRNQCVFLSRYQMRYRKFPWKNRKIRAAGYRNDPTSEDDSEDMTDTSDTSDTEDGVIEDDCAPPKVCLLRRAAWWKCLLML